MMDFFAIDTILVTNTSSLCKNIKNRLPKIITEHQKINHTKREFKNTQGYTTNLIESVWNELKHFCKTPGHINHLEIMIDYFILKKNHGHRSENLFDLLLSLFKINIYVLYYYILSSQFL